MFNSFILEMFIFVLESDILICECVDIYYFVYKKITLIINSYKCRRTWTFLKEKF